MIDVSIVIPVYNEEGILREAITDLRASLASLRERLGAPLTFEVIIAENVVPNASAEAMNVWLDTIRSRVAPSPLTLSFARRSKGCVSGSST